MDSFTQELAMNVSFMQRVDHWVGVPLCGVLACFLSLKRFLFPLHRETSIRNILFIELSEMGSTVLAWPAMREAQKLTGESGELFFLIFESNKESISLLNIIPKDNILTIDDRNFWRLTVSTAALIPRLWHFKIDTTIDLELYSRFTAILSLLSGAARRVGFHNFTEEGLYRGNFLTSKVSYNPFIHISQNFLALVASLASKDAPPLPKTPLLPITPLPSPIAFGDEERAAAQELLSKSRHPTNSSHQLILMDPYPGQLPLRAWPLDSYRELIQKLLEAYDNVSIGITGLQCSAPYLQPLFDLLPRDRVFSLVGKTGSLRELLAIFTHARLLISNDGGPAHFATLTDTPSIVLFGPESPHRYRPLGEHSHALSAHFHCSPCFSAANHRRSACTDNQCMKALPVDTVFLLAQELLS
ncbi:MAG: glycosyltransferase family 9 protein [Bdellovibrionales bacterium]|nr:glycosyltransferase family 9 protein [Bdellovibrionales bacterium]